MGAYVLALLTSVGDGATDDLWEGVADSSRMFWYERSMAKEGAVTGQAC